MKPRIAITCDVETITDRRGAPSPRYLCPTAYCDAVLRAGGTPLLFTPMDAEHVPSLLDTVDALVVSGGDFDVPPAYYNQAPRPKLGKILESRSASERALIQEALRRRMPLLGVCGGMQLLNVVCGGTLFQDVSERPHTDEHTQPHDKRQPAHKVRLTAGSLLARAMGGLDVQVNSTHHQIVDEPGQGIQVTGQSPDGVVEAIELTGHAFVAGVQWHPELLEGPEHAGIYGALVRAAQKPSK